MQLITDKHEKRINQSCNNCRFSGKDYRMSTQERPEYDICNACEMILTQWQINETLEVKNAD